MSDGGHDERHVGRWPLGLWPFGKSGYFDKLCIILSRMVMDACR
jgi:hypothetical protein